MKYVVYIREAYYRVAHKFSDDYTYITDSQEIADILGMVDLGHKSDEITAMFVLVGDGDYDEIWVTDSGGPYVVGCPYYRVISYYRSI